MTEQVAFNPIKTGRSIGLIAGVVTIVYCVLLYLVDASLLTKPWILVSFFIIVGFKMYAAFKVWQVRRRNTLFRESLQAVFMVSVIGFLLWISFMYVMYNYIDPTVIEGLINRMTENITQAWNDGRITKHQLEEGLLKFEKVRFNFAIASMMYCIMLIAGFLYALIFAAISMFSGRDIAATN